MAITIKEIAELAGISRGTVDRVLHNRGNVRPEMADKIRRIAEENGFKMNKAGRMLAVRKKPLVIGCMMPGCGNAFFDEVIRGYEAACNELSDYGVSFKIRNIKGFDPKDHVEAINQLVAEDCRALCLSTLDVPEVTSSVNSLIEGGIPVFTVNTDIPGARRACYIGSDYRKGGRTAAQFLSKIVKKEELPLKVAVFTGSRFVLGHNERIAGFEEGLLEYGVPYSIADVVEGFDNDEYVFLPALALFDRHPDVNCVYITAACVSGVHTALRQSMDRLQSKPRVVVFDDAPETKRLIREGLIDFTICQSPFLQGYQAIHTLFNYVLDGSIRQAQGQNHSILMQTFIKITENLDDEI